MPGLAMPGLAMPGLAMPGLAMPGLAMPGLAMPGLAMFVRCAVLVLAPALRGPAAFGVMCAGRSAARPIVAVNQAVIVEIMVRCGEGHGVLSGWCLLTLSTHGHPYVSPAISSQRLEYCQAVDRPGCEVAKPVKAPPGARAAGTGPTGTGGTAFLATPRWAAIQLVV